MRVLLLMLCLAVAVQAQDAKAVQDKADAAMAPVIASIQSFQSTWVMTHKGYWQGVRTPQTIPTDGVDTVPDKNLKPAKDTEGTAWKDVSVTVPATLPCSVAVITHDGPAGKGYTIRLLVKSGSQSFRKSIGSGPGSQTTGWAEVKAVGGGK